MEQVGVIEQRRGIGVLVKDLYLEKLMENMEYGIGGELRKIEEVIEIRREMEIGIIEKKMERIGEEEIKEMREKMEKMRKREERGEGFNEEERKFKKLMLRCKENEVMIRMIEVLWIEL